MWGTFSQDEKKNFTCFSSYGYVGLIKNKNKGYQSFLCEAGSQSQHDAGYFNTTYDISSRSLIARGYYNLFDNEYEVKCAFVKYQNDYTLEKIVKVKYTQSIEIVEGE